MRNERRTEWLSGKQGRVADRDKILRLLAETEGLSNFRVRTEIGLGDDRYEKVRDELLEESLIEKYVCNAGGIRLTRKGERSVPRGAGGAFPVTV